MVTPDGVMTHGVPELGTLRIGRDESCDLRLDDPSVSRKHASLTAGDALVIEDLGGSNGTALKRNLPSQRSGETQNLLHLRRERATLDVGDRILLGTVQLVLVKARREAAEAQADDDLDPRMRALHSQAERAARSAISVLIQGETGAGKDVLARYVHARSGRSGPFLAINCAALPEALLEAELFGSEKGAFTGSTQARPGLLESAQGGTVFLDEVGELPLATQAKLLRVVEERKVMRVGGRTARDIDVRFVSATNRDLETRSREGGFREDLYYRLNGITLQVPPLRERGREIESLAASFLAATCQALGKKILPLAPQTVAALKRHRWPGNVRELKNAIERAALLCDGDVILPEHLPERMLTAAPPPAEPALLPSQPEAGAASLEDQMKRIDEEQRELERERIRRALAETGGNQKRAAELLGISRRTLSTRLNELDLPRPRK